jgi:hypothetical protein
MAVIGFREITQEDMKDETLAVLNTLLRDLSTEINRLSGYSGVIQLQNDLDLTEHNLLNAENIPGTDL